MTPDAVRGRPEVGGDGFWFLDPAIAWAALADPGDPTTAVVLATVDGGMRWKERSMKVDFSGEQPGGRNEIFLLDASMGWLVAKAQTSSAFSRGVLYRTSDGGETWTRSAIPIADSLTFVTPADGWIAGGPGGGELYATQDGGTTWKPEPVPHRSAEQPWRTTVAAPVPIGPRTAVMPVQVRLSSMADGSELYFHLTRDAGRTWVQAGDPLVTKQGGDIFHGSADDRLSVVDAQTWFLLADGLWNTSNGGTSWTPVIGDRDLRDGAKMAFVSRDEGWLYRERMSCPDKQNCTTTWALLHTTDGGRSWRSVRIP